jgi:carbon-monoxide dehydrogenase large subunit
MPVDLRQYRGVPVRLPDHPAKRIAEISPTNPLGIKAGGEGGTTAAPAVIISAIVDALSPYGVRNINMPASAATIWKAIQDAKADAAEAIRHSG